MAYTFNIALVKQWSAEQLDDSNVPQIAASAEIDAADGLLYPYGMAKITDNRGLEYEYELNLVTYNSAESKITLQLGAEPDDVAYILKMKDRRMIMNEYNNIADNYNTFTGSGMVQGSIGEFQMGNFSANKIFTGSITSTRFYEDVGGMRIDLDEAKIYILEPDGLEIISSGGINIGNGGSLRGGQTEYNVGKGFFFGYSSSVGKYVLSIGDSSGNHLTYDGLDLSITGAIIATSGSIGGWTIADGYIYSLATGTPSASPSDGIVLASANQALIVYENTQKRIELGYLSAGVYGIKGYADDGTTTIFEMSDSATMVAGWNFTSTTLANGTNIILDSGNKAISILNATYESSGIQLQYNSGVPRFHVGNGTTKYFKYDGTDISWKGTYTELTAAGNLTCTGGAIGGWIINSSLLKSAASGARIELNKGENRVSIFDAVNEKIIMGYLNGAVRNNAHGDATAGSSNTLTDDDKGFDWANNELVGLELYLTGGTGSGQNLTITANTVDTITVTGVFSPAPAAGTDYEVRYGVADYGFYALAGDSLNIDGDLTYESGDWLIQHDASLLIKDGLGNTIVRLGTDTGDKGLFIYNTSGVQLARLVSDEIYVGNAGGTSYFNYDGTKVTWKGANTELDGSGYLTCTGGTIGGWTIGATTLASGTNIILDSSNKAISISNATFGNIGIQLQYNAGSPRFYVGDGSDSYLKYDSADGVVISIDVSAGLTIQSGGNLYIKGDNATWVYDGIDAGGTTIMCVYPLGTPAGSLSLGKDPTTTNYIGDSSLYGRTRAALASYNSTDSRDVYLEFDGATLKGFPVTAAIDLGSATSPFGEVFCETIRAQEVLVNSCSIQLGDNVTKPLEGQSKIWNEPNGDVIIASNVGGVVRRKVLFDYSSGEIWN